MKPKSASARPMLLYTPEKDGTIMERAAAAFEEDLRSVSQYCEEEILSSLSQSGDEGCVQVAFEWSEVVAAARGISSRNNMVSIMCPMRPIVQCSTVSAQQAEHLFSYFFGFRTLMYVWC